MEVIIATLLEAVASESVLTACNNDVKLSETRNVRFARLFDLARERERQLTTARANQTTCLTNGRAANLHRKWSLVFSARFPVVK